MERAGEILKQITVATSKANTPTVSNTEGADDIRDSEVRVGPHCGGLGFLRHDLPVTHPDFGKLFPCASRLAKMDARRTQELRKLSNLGAVARYTLGRFVG